MQRIAAIISIALSLLLNFSCQKKVTTVTAGVNPLLEEYFKLDVGNYWIYDIASFDSTGVQTYSATDSFFVYQKDQISENEENVLRGSFRYNTILASWILWESILVHLNQNQIDWPIPIDITIDSGIISDIFYHDAHSYLERLVTKIPDDTTLTLPAGTFECRHYILFEHYQQFNGSNILVKDFNWQLNYFYSKGIGLVCFETSEPANGDFSRYVLRRYHVN